MTDEHGYGVAVWSSAGWRQAAVAWIDEQLAAAGLSRTGEPEQPHVKPWATALRVPTTGGPVWMKAAGPATAFEVGLYEVLHAVAPEHVLRPIATDTDRAWMILEDGGASLGQALEGEPLEEAMVVAFTRYGELQRLAAPHAQALIDGGAADMRPSVLPARFDQALQVVAGAGDRGTLERLARLRPDVERWCQELAEAPGPVSIDHNDLHPHNVFVGPPPRVYDWGDSVVTHPFASMLTGLAFVTGHMRMPPSGDPRVRRLRDAYLDAFADLAPHAELVRTVTLARRVALIAHTLTWDRVLGAMSPGEVPEDRAGMPFRFLASLLDDGAGDADPGP